MDLKLDTNKAIALAEDEAGKLIDTSQIKVTSQPTFENAKEQLKQVKTIKKFVKEKRESITKPLHDAKKAAIDLFKPVENQIKQVEDKLNSEMLAYNKKLLAEQKKREEEAAAKLAEAQDKGEEVDMDKVTRKLNNTTENLGKIRTRKVKKFRVLDINKIPRDYLTLNESLVKDVMRKEGAAIPGIEFYTDDVPVNSY